MNLSTMTPEDITALASDVCPHGAWETVNLHAEGIVNNRAVFVSIDPSESYFQVLTHAHGLQIAKDKDALRPLLT